MRGETGIETMRQNGHRFGSLPPVVFAVVVTAIVFIATPAGPTSSASAPVQDDGGDRGAMLYGRDCAGCHGSEGEGSTRGVSLVDSGEAATHYMVVTGRMPIRDADEPIRRSEPRYSRDEIDALVDHVAGFGDGPELPDVDGQDGDVPRGGELYRLHCGMCHSATGIGGALAYDEFAPDVTEAEPSVVVAAVTAGPGAMPSFAPDGFDDEELASIVAYVGQLQAPDDRGGWPIFRAGRADEALVALAVGLPSLVLMAAWLARRVR